MPAPIRHVSFDVWNTLVKANPDYATARTEWLRQRTGLPPSVIQAQHVAVKQYVDTVAVRTGYGPTARECYTTLSALLWTQSGHVLDAEELEREFRDLFEKHPPIIIPEARAIVDLLRRDRVTMSIGSNTTFIPGYGVMREFLQREFGDDTFTFFVFSDSMRVAKPCMVFFEGIVSMARVCATQSYPDLPVLARSEVLHVGDNDHFDRIAAINAGLQAQLIVTPADFNNIYSATKAQSK